MVFTDGQKRSVERVLSIFDEFASISGLKICLENFALYMAGITTADQNAILHNLSFAAGQLPIRYLGLPLLTKKMTVSDYTPLMKKIRSRMCT